MKRTAPALLALTTALLAGCGEKEVATEHIRMVLGDTVASAADSAGAGDPPQAGDSATVTPDSAVAAGVLELPNGDTLTIRPSIVAFYRDRGYQPAWTDDDVILPRGEAMLEAIGAANTEGLDRERYHFSTAREMARLLSEDAVEDRELEYLGNLDLLLSESFARLAHDLKAGTLDPDKAGLDWRIERGTVDDRELIERVVGGEGPKAVLGSVRPDVPYYDRMMHALRRLRDVEESGGWGTVPEGETLEPGVRADRVAAVRSRLAAADDSVETRLASVGAQDPRLFDDSLARAISHFQTRHTLHEDGAIGPKTLAAMNVPVEERIENVRLNLDRWRWLPNDLGERFIIVNIAGFELEYVENDEAVESMNVVVGKTANRTPVFQDTLQYVVVNPYWNVPRSIAEEEIIPAARRDPGYLVRNNYELVRNGTAIPPQAVPPEALESRAYRIRQKPGPGNALGHVKFLFPNDYDIYLHDTPADHLFTQTSRAFSHGCIRVERPDDLATTLLTRLTDRDEAYYRQLRSSDGEQWIALEQEVPVYILYFTAWADEDGTLRFHEDIYQRDESLEGERRDELAPVEPRPIPAQDRG